jgi:mono/diheme cytochrome c family protein
MPRSLPLLGFVLSTTAFVTSAAAQIPTTGEGLYGIACARCHGDDGQGVEPDQIAFDVPVPDFTDCSFASREPDGDWIAVAYEGGPVRGFDETMPAFGEALNEEQLKLVMDYIRTFCGNDDWPRGELNLPRPLITEKAFPEDEAVTTISAEFQQPGAIINELVYERRVGARHQLEVKVPFGIRESSTGGDWTAGIGDITLGWKTVLFHSLQGGSIVSLGGEVKLATGKVGVLGKGTTVLEPYLSVGKLLPNDAFMHLQAIVEFPVDTDLAESEFKWRGVLGRTWTSGRFGRAWTPMVEVLGETGFHGGPVNWDLVPQLQVTLNTRQHVIGNIGIMLPISRSDTRSARLLLYIMWDWFDGGCLPDGNDTGSISIDRHRAARRRGTRVDRSTGAVGWAGLRCASEQDREHSGHGDVCGKCAGG